MPCLALKGVANAIAGSRMLKAKVLLRRSSRFPAFAWSDFAVVNSVNDRETDGYTAVDYIRYDSRELRTCNVAESLLE